jgi:hypothetical protein
LMSAQLGGPDYPNWAHVDGPIYLS